ncbi:hypothetical protein AG1IA_07983 [Rhizoctonia solani AG-1 IA]|uniref:Uncharacterized protein n=1 Tax=Thanatephorus cucumeris (strain AG1-IA) TaxID=983506 RepID=L8WJ78_THACA|nr:hypothetical protein AG1IA_07983 [Rhizoctonia solani AG-1 IA]
MKYMDSTPAGHCVPPRGQFCLLPTHHSLSISLFSAPFGFTVGKRPIHSFHMFQARRQCGSNTLIGLIHSMIR